MSVEIILLIWILGIGLLATELFIPSLIAGSIGTLAVVGSIAAMFIEHGPLYGGALTVVSAVLSAAIVGFGGKRLALKKELTAEAGFVGTDDRSDLIGMTGVTTTVLRPGGYANIGGRKVDVVTDGDMVEAGAPVEVVAVEGNRIQVRVKE